MSKKILIGIPPISHVILGLDEFDGLSKLGYECQQVTYTRNKWNISVINRMYGVLINAFKVVRKLNQFKPDILYLNTRFDKNGILRDVISITIFRFFYRRKFEIIIKSHGSDLKILEQNSFFLKKLVVPNLVSRVDAWFFLSKDEIVEFSNYFPKLKEKAFLTYNIIDPDRSVSSDDFKARHRLPDDLFKFLFVGRMVKDKGVFAIIEAIAKFKNRDQCLFVMVGNGTELENLKSKVAELGITRNVLFTDFIEEVECDHFYANTDALVFPSLDEGFAMALFKSVASGLPIITTQIRAAKDQLRSPENCLWVNGESGDSVLSAIEEIYNNRELRISMSVNNLKLGKKFNKSAVCEDMHHSLQKL